METEASINLMLQNKIQISDYSDLLIYILSELFKNTNKSYSNLLIPRLMSSFCKYFQNPKGNRFGPLTSETQLESNPRQFFSQNQIKIEKEYLSIENSPMTTTRAKKSLKKLLNSPKKSSNTEIVQTIDFHQKKSNEVVSDIKRLAHSNSTNGTISKQHEIKPRTSKSNNMPKMDEFLSVQQNPFLKKKTNQRPTNAQTKTQQISSTDSLIPYLIPFLSPFPELKILNQTKGRTRLQNEHNYNQIQTQPNSSDHRKAVFLTTNQNQEYILIIPELSDSFSLGADKLSFNKTKSLDIFAKRAQSEPDGSQTSISVIADSIGNDFGRDFWTERITSRRNPVHQMDGQNEEENIQAVKSLKFNWKVRNGKFIRNLI